MLMTCPPARDFPFEFCYVLLQPLRTLPEKQVTFPPESEALASQHTPMSITRSTCYWCAHLISNAGDLWHW
jgi:hypothetical protein